LILGNTVTGPSSNPYIEIFREQVRAVLSTQRIPLPAYFSESRDERIKDPRARDGFVDLEKRARCGACEGRGCANCQGGTVTVIVRDPYREKPRRNGGNGGGLVGVEPRTSNLRLSRQEVEDALSRLPRGLGGEAAIRWVTDNVTTPLELSRREWDVRMETFAPLIRRAWVEEPQKASELARRIGATKNYVKRALRAASTASASAA
jgi:hypothetical protein